MNYLPILYTMDALYYLVDSCKNDIEFVHDILIGTTLGNYTSNDSTQYITSINKLDIDDLKKRLDAIAVKRDMINTLVIDTLHTAHELPRNIPTHIRHISSTNSLLFQMDDMM